jgi:hypothetical protein
MKASNKEILPNESLCYSNTELRKFTVLTSFHSNPFAVSMAPRLPLPAANKALKMASFIPIHASRNRVVTWSLNLYRLCLNKYITKEIQDIKSLKN